MLTAGSCRRLAGSHSRPDRLVARAHSLCMCVYKPITPHAALFPRVQRALPACYVLAAPYLSPARGPLDGTACSADSPRRVQALPLEACTLRPVIAGLPPDARLPCTL